MIHGTLIQWLVKIIGKYFIIFYIGWRLIDLVCILSTRYMTNFKLTTLLNIDKNSRNIRGKAYWRSDIYLLL